MTSPTWPEIVTRLRDTLVRCDRDTDLELSAGPRALRLLVRRDRVQVLCPGYDEGRLAALGWRRATGGTFWWYETPRTPEQLDRLSLFVTRTAAEVLTGDPGALACRPVPGPTPGDPTRPPAAGPSPGDPTRPPATGPHRPPADRTAVPAAAGAAGRAGAHDERPVGSAPVPTPSGSPDAGPTAAGPAPAAVPSGSPVEEPTTAAPDVSTLLAEAAERRDLAAYLGVLAGAPVCVPLAGDPAPGGDFPWTVVGDAAGAPLLPVFTSPDSLTAFAGVGVPFVALPCAELFDDWPDASWGLAVDPGSAATVTLSAPALAGLLAANTAAG
jgi:hypothetical protein